MCCATILQRDMFASKTGIKKLKQGQFTTFRVEQLLTLRKVEPLLPGEMQMVRSSGSIPKLGLCRQSEFGI